MKPKSQRIILVTGIVLVALLLDQALKLYIRTHFYLGESHEILPFFYLCFVENNGMAFGIEWFDKLFLTLFRIGAVGLLGYYMHSLVNQPIIKKGYLASIALITAGALGNIIDCVFYGKLFGYEDWFYGKVVDMLYFPLITNSAGECLFFRPVFNLADSCITVAVFLILFFYRKDLDNSLSNKKNEQ